MTRRRDTDLDEMARQHQAELEAAETRPGYKLFAALPWTPDNALRIAREFIASAGDVPEDVMHAFRIQLEEEVVCSIQELPRQHFAGLGIPVPEYPGNYPR